MQKDLGQILLFFLLLAHPIMSRDKSLENPQDINQREIKFSFTAQSREGQSASIWSQLQTDLQSWDSAAPINPKVELKLG
jgi:hypothetical protein